MNYTFENLTKESLAVITANRRNYRDNIENLGSASTFSHLNSATVDWNMEQQWNSKRAFAIKMINEQGDVVGCVFFTHTISGERHWTLRHITVFEEYRKMGVATILLNHFYNLIYTNPINIHWLRFFSDKKSIKFYEKFDFKWLGLSKSGLPYTYVKIMDSDVRTSNKLFNEIRDDEYARLNTRIKLQKQFAKLQEVWYEFKDVPDNLNKFF